MTPDPSHSAFRRAIEEAAKLVRNHFAVDVDCRDRLASDLRTEIPNPFPEEAELGDVEKMRARKDAAYEERNRVVAALARLFPSGVARTDIPGWHAEWHGCVYIDTPQGQLSWHFHDSQAHLFAGLPPYAGTWDGHTTDEKYRRLEALRAEEAEPQESALIEVARTRCVCGCVLAIHIDSEGGRTFCWGKSVTCGCQEFRLPRALSPDQDETDAEIGEK